MTAAAELFAVLRLSGEDRTEAERLIAARDAEVLTETAADLKAHCLVHNRFAATGFMDCPCRVADELLRKAKETRREPEHQPCTCRRLPMPAGQTCNAHQTKENLS